jgi:predicted RNase H-like nuclease (RuvC/YqgF family)
MEAEKRSALERERLQKEHKERQAAETERLQQVRLVQAQEERQERLEREQKGRRERLEREEEERRERLEREWEAEQLKPEIICKKARKLNMDGLTPITTIVLEELHVESLGLKRVLVMTSKIFGPLGLKGLELTKEKVDELKLSKDDVIPTPQDASVYRLSVDYLCGLGFSLADLHNEAEYTLEDLRQEGVPIGRVLDTFPERPTSHFKKAKYTAKQLHQADKRRFSLQVRG